MSSVKVISLFVNVFYDAEGSNFVWKSYGIVTLSM